MKKLLSIVALGVLLAGALNAQNKRYTVMFYNVENLFDTINDPNVRDEEFTPEGSNKWTGKKYWKKISNLEKVFYAIAQDTRSFPTIIGVSEIENRNVLEDIVSQDKLLKANYQIVHYDSPERRGVDVALFYRPDQFKFEGSHPILVTYPNQPDYKTRDVLSVWGTIEGEQFMFLVAHWPSRSGGHIASNPRRWNLANITRAYIDSVQNANPAMKIIAMGDFNDNPTDESILKCLRAKGDINKLEKSDLFNPYWRIFKDGIGTLAYQDEWSLFDNIVVSQNIANSEKNKFGLVKFGKYYARIFNKSFLLQQSGQYKGYPLRTYVGGNFQDGYSDHLPVFIQLEKTK